jgi:hypothetical protein
VAMVKLGEIGKKAPISAVKCMEIRRERVKFHAQRPNWHAQVMKLATKSLISEFHGGWKKFQNYAFLGILEKFKNGKKKFGYFFVYDVNMMWR